MLDKSIDLQVCIGKILKTLIQSYYKYILSVSVYEYLSFKIGYNIERLSNNTDSTNSFSIAGGYWYNDLSL